MEPAIAIARMEARIDQEFSSHDDRIRSVHKRLGEVQISQSDQERKLAVISTEVDEARSDIKESRDDLSKQITGMQSSFNERTEKMQKGFDERTEKMQQNFDHKFETLTGAVRWGTGAVVAAIGVLLTLLTQIH